MSIIVSLNQSDQQPYKSSPRPLPAEPVGKSNCQSQSGVKKTVFPFIQSPQCCFLFSYHEKASLLTSLGSPIAFKWEGPFLFYRLSFLNQASSFREFFTGCWLTQVHILKPGKMELCDHMTTSCKVMLIQDFKKYYLENIITSENRKSNDVIINKLKLNLVCCLTC